MLVLEPKLYEEMVFKNGDFEIRLKFFLNKNNQIRVGITAPSSVKISRERTKKPTEPAHLYEHHLKDKRRV